MATKKKHKPEIQPPACLHCKKPARRVSGRVIYPNRPDLYDLILWECKPCLAYVGSHKRGGKPKGYPGNARIRRVRKKVHGVLDPIWRNADKDPAYENSEKDMAAIRKIQGSARGRVYKWLGHHMGLLSDECHVGKFGYAQCQAAYYLCNRANYTEIREWYKANKKRE